jgi:phenylalanyl-tRNA synthetase beta chain
MSHDATPSSTSPNLVDVFIPPTRADVLHQADIMEDVAIAYGFNNLPRYFPSKSGTVAKPLMINKLGDIVRLEAAMAGWSEVMPLILCSHDENFKWLNRKDDGTTAVRLANPKTAEYQVVRTSLLPGLLKTIRENKHHSVPIKVFEVSDIALKAPSLERKSRNERHFAAAWYGKSSGFEMVHGLLDRIMLMLKSAFLVHEEGLEGKIADGYWIEEVDGTTVLSSQDLKSKLTSAQIQPSSPVTQHLSTFEWAARSKPLAFSECESPVSIHDERNPLTLRQQITSVCFETF